VIVLFCIILPLQVASKLHYWTIPIVGFTVFTYEGIDTIGKEIEDPFGVDHNDLPLHGYCLQIKEEIERFFPPATHLDEESRRESQRESQREGDNEDDQAALFGQIQRYTRAYESCGIHVVDIEHASMDFDLENQLISYTAAGSSGGRRKGSLESGRNSTRVAVAASDSGDMAPVSPADERVAPVSDLS
jgi:hypothetical protein